MPIRLFAFFSHTHTKHRTIEMSGATYMHNQLAEARKSYRWIRRENKLFSHMRAKKNDLNYIDERLTWWTNKKKIGSKHAVKRPRNACKWHTFAFFWHSMESEMKKKKTAIKTISPSGTSLCSSEFMMNTSEISFLL